MMILGCFAVVLRDFARVMAAAGFLKVEISFSYWVDHDVEVSSLLCQFRPPKDASCVFPERHTVQFLRRPQPPPKHLLPLSHTASTYDPTS